MQYLRRGGCLLALLIFSFGTAALVNFIRTKGGKTEAKTAVGIAHQFVQQKLEEDDWEISTTNFDPRGSRAMVTKRSEHHYTVAGYLEVKRSRGVAPWTQLNYWVNLYYDPDLRTWHPEDVRLSER